MDLGFKDETRLDGVGPDIGVHQVVLVRGVELGGYDGTLYVPTRVEEERAA